MDIDTEVEVGSVFAKDFRIQRRLRSGGMGSVFVVEQISTKKLRALKLLAPSLAHHPESRERFGREAQAASAIDSDHVVEIVCAGTDEATSTPYLVMDLLNGEDLADRIENSGPMDPLEVERVMSQLGHALMRAHAKGIVHRDLKPENIFLATSRREEDALCTKILDFGVAKFVNQHSAEAGTLPVGSPAYMAPEQTDAYGNITPAADVWSLGLLAFFLLVGRSYWTAGEAGSVPALLREVCFEPIEPPSVRLQRLQCQAVLPIGFDDWFLRCVERDLEKRFRSAEQAVTAYPRAPRVAATPASKPGERKSNPDGFALPVLAPAERPSKLRHTASAALAIAVLAGGGGGLIAFVLTPKQQRSAPAAQASAPETQQESGSSTSTGDHTFVDEKPFVEDEPMNEPALARSVTSPDQASSPCPAGRLILNHLCIDRLEVSVAGYFECVRSKVCAPLSGVVAYDGLRPDIASRYSPLCNRDASQADLPVNCVTYEAASTYCLWKNGALPTDDQWLGAARNQGTTPFPWGEGTPSELRVNACGEECERWAFANSLFVKRLFQASDRHSRAAPGGSYPQGASKSGVYDLIGNVAEWTTTEPGDMAAARGGSYLSNRPEQFVEPRRIKKSSSSHLIGFRCVTPAQ